MKQFTYLSLIFCIITTFGAQGQAINQSNTSINLRRYVTDMRFIGQKSLQSGVLFDLTDSSVVLAPINGLKPMIKTLIRQHGGTLPPIDSLRAALPLRVYRYADISRLTLHRRGHTGKGFLIGAGLGVALGFIQGDDKSGFIRFPASVYAVVYGAIFSGVGSIIGAAHIKSVNAREQSVATEVPRRFQKFTIVEQLKQANLFTP